MATYITVAGTGGSRLLEANSRQTAANRKGLAQYDQGKQLRALEPLQQVSPIVGPRRPILPIAELSVSRRRIGGFGFLDVNGGKINSVEPYFNARYKINPMLPLPRCKVIRVNVADPDDACVGRNTLPAPFFAGKEAELIRFIYNGGVLWVNNEYQGCGINASVFNSYLSTTFGATVGFVDDLQPEGTRVPLGPFDEIIRNSLAYTAQSGLAPPYFYTAATCTITGGTPYYSSVHGPVCSFQRMGQGFLVLSGDSNGTAEFPSFTEGGRNFIDALLALR